MRPVGRCLWITFGVIVTLALAAGSASAQTVYRLHREASSTSGFFQLKAIPPDAAFLANLSINLAGQPVGEYRVKEFDTQVGDPGIAGVVPSGSVLSFTVWMRKTNNRGTQVPRVRVRVNSATGPLLCQATGTTAITQTSTAYTLSCATTAAVTLASTDRLYLWAGVNVTAQATGSQAVQAELDIEGTPLGSYDSRFSLNLPPAITSLTPSMAPIGTSVTIAGKNFGSSQGTSTVKFNGVTATPTNWTDTSIDVPVPSGATTGPVVVTVSGVNSLGATFTVRPNITSVSPTSGLVGASITLTGTSFGATQGGSTVTFNGTTAAPTSWSATSIVVPVPAAATTGPIVVTVGGVASTGVAFTVLVLPALTSLTPSTGLIHQVITIAGTNFGASQGVSTVTFNGIPVTHVVSWSATSLSVRVPAGATAGPVVATVNGLVSNSLPFALTASPVLTNLSPTSGTVGQAVTLTGSGFGATQGSSTVTFNGVLATVSSWSATSIAATVPALATTGPVIVRVNGEATAGSPFTVVTGTLTGSVTRAAGGTPIGAATVLALVGSTVVASATTATSGAYTLTLAPGTYTVRAFASGFVMAQQAGVAVAAGNTTPVSLALADATPGTPITYLYDALSRLVSVVDPSQGTATYRYDAVGNIVGIDRTGISQVTLFTMHPQSGPVGTTVTLGGTGFSTTPSQNTVTFNGTAATVTSATTTQLGLSESRPSTSGAAGAVLPLRSGRERLVCVWHGAGERRRRARGAGARDAVLRVYRGDVQCGGAAGADGAAPGELSVRWESGGSVDGAGRGGDDRSDAARRLAAVADADVPAERHDVPGLWDRRAVHLQSQSLVGAAVSGSGSDSARRGAGALRADVGGDRLCGCGVREHGDADGVLPVGDLVARLRVDPAAEGRDAVPVLRRRVALVDPGPVRQSDHDHAPVDVRQHHAGDLTERAVDRLHVRREQSDHAGPRQRRPDDRVRVRRLGAPVEGNRCDGRGDDLHLRYGASAEDGHEPPQHPAADQRLRCERTGAAADAGQRRHVSVRLHAERQRQGGPDGRDGPAGDGAADDVQRSWLLSVGHKGGGVARGAKDDVDAGGDVEPGAEHDRRAEPADHPDARYRRKRHERHAAGRDGRGGDDDDDLRIGVQLADQRDGPARAHDELHAGHPGQRDQHR